MTCNNRVQLCLARGGATAEEEEAEWSKSAQRATGGDRRQDTADRSIDPWTSL